MSMTFNFVLSSFFSMALLADEERHQREIDGVISTPAWCDDIFSLFCVFSSTMTEVQFSKGISYTEISINIPSTECNSFENN